MSKKKTGQVWLFPVGECFDLSKVGAQNNEPMHIFSVDVLSIICLCCKLKIPVKVYF